MKSKLFIGLSIITCLLTGCAKYQMPPFSHGNGWKLVGNHTVSERICTDIDFGGGSTMPIANSSNGEYELNFITDAPGYDLYDTFCRNYIATMLGKLPMQLDSIHFILADRYVVAEPSVLTRWMPDLIRLDDGTVLVAQGIRPASDIQPHNELWRNVIFDKTMKRIAVVDRFIKNGKHLAIIYILQNENKRVPFAGTFQFDIFDPDNIQPVGLAMESLLDISVKAMETHNVMSYNDYVHIADSCFMACDYIAASNAFEQAFLITDRVQGTHLYNAACAAALAGLPDVAFERLARRLQENPDWFVDDPNADADLQSLHGDERWAVYSDSLTRRRERIEANYNKPLRHKLLDIADKDQSIRYRYLDAVKREPQDSAQIATLLAEMQRIDAENQKEIANILDKEGFAGSDVVGNATFVYWLIVQHAPVEMQRKYFPLFVSAAERGDISRECIAMMDDRIAMFEGRPQRYGTQIVDGKVYKLVDPANVDTFRQEMEMPPLDKYLLQMGATR